MLFTDLLNKLGLTEETVSAGLKTKIKRYHKFVDAINKEKENLAKATTARTKEVSETEIRKGEEFITTLNDEICQGVQRFFDNRELNERKAKNLEKTRAAKGKNKGATTSTPAEETPTPAPEENVEETPTPAPEEKVEETPIEEVPAVVEEPVKEKKKTPWGLILGISLALATGGAIAYNHFKNKE